MDTVIYVVQQGDTLSEIARKYNTTVNMIARYNGIADVDFLEVDRVLRIPVSTIPNMSMNKEYTIQDGDTLAGIAEKFGTTVEDLVRLNGIADPDEIWAGNVIKIPLSAVKLPMPKPKNQYIVKEGDTLAKIADMHDMTAEMLADFNDISNPDVLAVGQVIRIPADRKRPHDGTIRYIVESGDTLWKIARRYGVSVAELINFNRLTQPDLIYPGQVIMIPE